MSLTTQMRITLMTAIMLVGLQSAVLAYDLSETLSIGGVLALGYQYQILGPVDGADDQGGVAVPFQPELSFRPTGTDAFFVKFGFAADNGLNDKTPFSMSPWAADLEDDVKHINGRQRDYLLTAWYKHVFKLGAEHTLSVSGGLIDATDYLDENAFSNDEYTQFMNAALVNGPNVFLPSYDIGGAIELDLERFALKAVVMNIGENDDGKNFIFFGLQLAYTMHTTFGDGTYRLVGTGGTRAFREPGGTGMEPRVGILLSCDQALGDIIGAFLRLGWQTDDAAVSFKTIYSGGLNLSGKLWRRPQDNIGMGYAYLAGGNTGIRHAHVFEAYVRFVLNTYIALSVDLQYMDEPLDSGVGPRGWIPGFRLTAEF
jgi:hypothetical protein